MGKTYKDKLDPWGKKPRTRRPRKGVTVDDSSDNSKNRKGGRDGEGNFEKFKSKR
tara:strand:- start:5647 stop:5811 length:165 start_codon:yes stop_codon:yes gene_type:complete